MDYTQTAIEEYRLSEKGRKAVLKFLERKGCTVLEELEEGFLNIVFDDDGELVFAACTVGHGQFVEPDIDKLRQAFEMEAIKWLSSAKNAMLDCSFRFDSISIVVVSEDKALLRHHINVLNALEEGEEKNV